MHKIGPGDIKNSLNVIIEISAFSNPVKYEIDKNTELLHVDRFMSTAMHYPANYGYVPQTLCDDGDPMDVLVITPHPIQAGSVITAKPVGILDMTDEKGQDAKIIAVPSDDLTSIYHNVKNFTDLPSMTIQQIEHFFEQYKALDKDKWVKIDGWGDAEKAIAAITASITN